MSIKEEYLVMVWHSAITMAPCTVIWLLAIYYSKVHCSWINDRPLFGRVILVTVCERELVQLKLNWSGFLQFGIASVKKIGCVLLLYEVN